MSVFSDQNFQEIAIRACEYFTNGAFVRELELCKSLRNIENGSSYNVSRSGSFEERLYTSRSYFSVGNSFSK